MTELQSAVALEQLKKVNKIVKKQDEIYNYLIKNINKDFYKIRPNLKENKNINVSLCIIFNKKKECEKFISFMNKNNIGFNKYCSNLINEFDTFKYNNSWNDKQYPYNINEYENTNCEKSKELFLKTAWFNLSSSLKKKHLNYIIKKMKEYESI